MSALRSFRSGRLRRVRSIAIVTVLIVAGLMWIGSAQAVHDNGMFELDGNTTHDSATTPPYDWNSLFGSSGQRLITPDPVNGPLLADAFFADAAVPDQTYFTSNKDTQPIHSGVQHWGCAPINNPLAKDDLQNAYAALVQVPQGAPDNAGHTVLYLGSERGSNNGTSFAGFWLLKDPTVGCSGTNAFSGQHTNGDILIVSDYTNGGGTQDVQVYKWVGDDATGGPVLQTSFNGGLCGPSLTNDDACAIANSSPITTPWSPTSHDTNTFVETGIDLTTLLGSAGGCFTNFLAETRSSAQITATLKDFAGGSFSTCVPPVITTTATPGGSQDPIGVSNEHDVASISGVTGRPDPTGTITFSLCNPSQVTPGSGCVSGGTQVGSPVTIANGSATSANASAALTTTPGTYCWRADYSPDADGAKFYVAGSHTDSTNECFTVIKNTPAIVTTPSPKSVTLGNSTVTLNDSAVLSGGSNPTGTITFTLVYNGATVDTETTSVNGNGTYSTPNGYTLPSSGTVTGTYQWNATYSGDSNNNSVSENNDASEQVTVNPANPTLVTTASPNGTVTLGDSGSPTLNDSAVLAGGYNPTGSITFTLKYNGSTVYTDHVTVNSGNGTYSTNASGDNPGGYTLPTNATVAGAYVWTASYSGDSNDNSASDPGTSALEQFNGAKAKPTLVTTASPNGTVTLNSGASPTLNDSAVLAGGYNPTGSITFTLKYNGSTVYTDVVTVSGNGTYSTATGSNPGGWTLPSNSTVTGSYVWTATYGGDGNNQTASDPGTSALEQVTVNKANPALVTTASPNGTVTLGTSSPTLNDSAVLSGGYNPTGTITFTLKYNGSTVDTETVSVSGNGTYSTPVGYTLPSSGIVTGSYVWTAVYGGDGNNTTANDPGTSAQEQVNVAPASPAVVTTATPNGTVTLDSGASPTLNDSAALSGGYHPTGTITFILKYNGSTVYTDHVQVNSGNGTYTTASGDEPGGYPLPTNATVTGSYVWTAIYSGDANNNSATDPGTSAQEQVTVNPASPTVVTTATPASVTLPGSVTFSDSAVVAGGYHPTGTLTFTLTGPNGFSYTQKDTVSGNGTYTASDGPISNPDAGTYTWSVSYNGDGNNNGAVDQGGRNEQTIVSPASPGIVTTPDPTSVTLGTGSVTLKDSAVLSGGSNPTGSITFTLVYNGSTVDSETVTVSGNGTYTTPVGYTLPSSGMVTGTYQWNASYTGDSNNNPVSENNSESEQVTVGPSSPNIVTTPDPTSAQLNGSPITLNDSAVLSGGYNPTGSITFTLVYQGVTVDTETVSVSGNGTYSTPVGYTLPSSGTVTGTYQWNATYTGDANNNSASENNDVSEQVTINPANPAISTTPSETAGSVNDLLNDTAHLSGGVQFDGTGTITFNLYGPSDPTCAGKPAYTETVTADHNGDYTTSNTTVLADTAGVWNWTATFSGDSNNTQALSGCGEEQVGIGAPVIHIHKTADKAQVNAGDNIGFTMTVWNSGSGDAKGVVLNDPLPTNPGLSWSVDSAGAGFGSGADCSINLGTLTCGPVTVPAGTDEASSTFWVHITSHTDKTTGGPCDETGGLVDNTGFVTTSNDGTDNSSAEICVAAPAIHIAKTADKAQVNAGDPIGFTMSVWNSGNGDAYNVNLSDPLPTNSGLNWQIESQGSGWNGTCQIVNNELDCGPVTVPAGTAKDDPAFTVHITSTTDKTTGGACDQTGGLVDNTGFVTTSNDGSDQSSAEICVAAPAIHIAKTADKAQVNAGDPIGFTMSVWNSGNGDAYNVKLSDPLPTNPGLNWQIDSQGSGWNGTCQIVNNELDCGPVTVPAGTQQGDPAFEVHITSTTDKTTGGACDETGGLVDNTGFVTTSNDGSDQSSAEICVAAPAIHIAKTADKAQVNAGEDIGFTMTVWNTGIGDAKGVTLTDPLPQNPGLSWSVDSAGTGFGSGADCSINLGTLTCGPVTVPAGTTQAASTFWVHITSHTDKTTGGPCNETGGLVDNTGFVTTTNDGSDQSSAEICVAAPVIHIQKTADATQVNAGEDIGFTMTVWNSGNGDAKGVTLTDPLPQNPGLSWSVDKAGAGFGSGADCSISQGTLTCGPETVPAGTTQAASTFWVHITSHTNKATAGDCEATGLVDNTGTVTTTNDGTDNSSASVCVLPADVSITKTADNSAPVHAGDPIGFTVEVKNTGTGAATGVQLSDPLPAGSGSGVTWAIDSSVGTPTKFVLSGAKGSQKLSLASSTLPAGADYKVHVTAQTSETECGTYDNTATLTTGNANNPEPASAQESCVYRVDLAITKSGSPATQILGTGNITWTMVVTNNGPDTDTGVKVSDPMPAGNTYVSSTTTQGTCTGGAILNCDIGTMAAGASVTITLVTTPSATGPQTNTAVVMGDRPETNLANNTASATVQVTGAPFVPCINIKRITPGHLIVGRKTVVTIYLAAQGRVVKGTRVRIKGAGINVKTAGANGKGVIKHTLKMKRKGILTFTPLAPKSCGTRRIGVIGVFTPPVTG
jgi:uncharacterized repeat protein (TIGR01451 family)